MPIKRGMGLSPLLISHAVALDCRLRAVSLCSVSGRLKYVYRRLD